MLTSYLKFLFFLAIMGSSGIIRVCLSFGSGHSLGFSPAPVLKVPVLALLSWSQWSQQSPSACVLDPQREGFAFLPMKDFSVVILHDLHIFKDFLVLSKGQT